MNVWQEVAAFGTSYLLLAIAGAAQLASLRWLIPAFGRPLVPPIPEDQISPSGFDPFTLFLMIATIPLLVIVPTVVDETLRDVGFYQWIYGESASSSLFSTAKQSAEVDSNPPDLSLQRERERLWARVLAGPLVLAILWVGWTILRKNHPGQARSIEANLGSSLCVGYLAWLAVTPIALLVNELAIKVMPTELVDHHTVELLARQNLSQYEWIVLFIAVAVIAPLVEEAVFRGVWLSLQLQRGWETQAFVAIVAFLIACVGGPRPDTNTFNPGPLLFVLALLPIVFVLPFWSEKATAPGPWLAIFTNGLFFGAMHSLAWPTPIALTLLGIALAWVRYRTSSIAGCVLLHGMFNAVSALVLALQSYFAEAS